MTQEMILIACLLSRHFIHLFGNLKGISENVKKSILSSNSLKFNAT